MLPFKENLDNISEESWLSTFINYQCVAGCMAEQHWHHYMELLYVFGGEAQQNIGNISFPFHTGDVLLIPSGITHSTKSLEKDCYISVTLFEYGINYPAYYLPAGKVKDMERLFSRMQEECVLRKKSWKTIAGGILFEILGLLERHGEILSPDESSSKEGLLIEEYLRENIANNLSLQSAAAFAGYSPAYFSRHFSDLMGMPFKQYVDKLKVRYARSMLDDGITTADIAAALGYENASSFCRAFKRLTGETPSEYRSREQKMYTDGNGL